MTEVIDYLTQYLFQIAVNLPQSKGDLGNIGD